MTDIGISCAKHSYGRGVGKIPMTCRADEDRWGLLCYPKCRAGYSQAGCCMCSRAAPLRFKLKDAAEAAGKLIDSIRNIPILGHIVKAFDAAIEAVLGPVLDAIPALRPFSLPGINVDALKNLPIKDAIDRIMETVRELLEAIKNKMTEFMEKIPSTIPMQCPELAIPLTRLALQHFNVPSAGRALNNAAVGNPLASLITRINSARKCPKSAAAVVAESLSKTSILHINSMTTGKEDSRKAKSTKKAKRKEDQRAQFIKNADLSELRLISIAADACTVPSKTSRKRSLVTRTLKMAVEQSTAFLEGMHDLNRANIAARADFSTMGGYFVQRLELHDEQGRELTKPVECIYNVDFVGDERTPVVGKFLKKQERDKQDKKLKVSGSKGTLLRKRKKVDIEFELRTEAAEWHPGDLGVSGFYYLKRTFYKDDEWSADPAKCKGTDFRCGEGAGCRVGGESNLPHDYTPLKLGTCGKGKVLAGVPQRRDTLIRSQLKKKPGSSWHFRNLVASGPSGKKNANPEFTIVAGPYVAPDEACAGLNAIEANIVPAMKIARDRTFGAIELLSDLRDGKIRTIEPVLSRMLLVAFGVKLIPGKPFESSFGGNPKDPVWSEAMRTQVAATGGATLAFHGGYFKKVYEETKSKSDLAEKLNPIIAKYKTIADYLMNTKNTGITIRHSIESFHHTAGAKARLAGFIPSGGAADVGTIYVDMASPNSKIEEYTIANTLVHEVSHAVVLTFDYFYYTLAGERPFQLPFVSTHDQLKQCRMRDHTVCATAKSRNAWSRLCKAVCDYSMGESAPGSCPLKSRADCFKDYQFLEGCRKFCAPQAPGFTGVKQVAYDFDLALNSIKVSWEGITAPLAKAGTGFETEHYGDNAASIGGFAVPELETFTSAREFDSKKDAKTGIGPLYRVFISMLEGKRNGFAKEDAVPDTYVAPLTEVKATKPKPPQEPCLQGLLKVTMC